MRHAFLRLMLPFLLLAQVTVGMSPGHAICIALEACCGGHVHPGLVGFASHRSHHALDHDRGHHHGHHHGHVHDSLHEHTCPEDCSHACCAEHERCDDDCSKGTSHFHIALPDDGGCVRDRSSDHLCDLRLLSPALAVFAAESVVALAPQATLPPPWSWPDCDRVRALETDSLVI